MFSNAGLLRGPWVAQFVRACFIARRARQFETAILPITPKAKTTTATDNQMSKPGSPTAEWSFPEVVRESGNESAAASMEQKAASLHRLNQQFAERVGAIHD